MSKPAIKSQTIQNAIASFIVLFLTIVLSTYDFETGKFRPPNQAEVAAILVGAKTLQGTIEGRKRATESIGKSNKDSKEEVTESAETQNLISIDSIDNEEDDLDVSFSNLKGKYYLVAQTDTKLKTSPVQSSELEISEYREVGQWQRIDIDAWKFLQERNEHIEVVIDEYSAINGGKFYAYAPHFKLFNLLDKEVEIEGPTAVVPVISKNKTAIKLPGYQSAFYLEDPIYPGSAFMWYEATKNGSRIPPTKQIVDNIILQAKNLDKLRAFNGNKPLVVTSWYRDPRTNAAVGGASRSDHLTGRSTDVFCPSMDIWDFQRVVLSFWKFGGVGKGANKGFCHVSSDASYRVWDY